MRSRTALSAPSRLPDSGRPDVDSQRAGGDGPLTPAERQFLFDSGLPSDAFDPVVKQAARERLRARAEETMRRASPALSAVQVAGLLNCAIEQVIGWSRSSDLYSYGKDGELRFPEWQFPDGQRIAELRVVLEELGRDMHPFSVEGLLAKVRHEELDEMTAVEWLVAGHPVEAVASLAKSHAHGW